LSLVHVSARQGRDTEPAQNALSPVHVKRKALIRNPFKTKNGGPERPPFLFLDVRQT